MAESLHVMQFGKYNGIDIEDVPDSYLEWAIGEDNIKERRKEFVKIAKQELKYRKDFDKPVR
jgi:uncharacterized protein (DUF3820 family)